MKHITSRIYADEKDFQTILDLITRIRPPAHLNDYPGKVDIEENLASAATRANTRLWFDDGQLIAWTYVDEFNNLLWELDNQYEELIGTEILDWGEFCVRTKLAKGETATLDANCRDDYSQRISFLDRHGFEPTQAFNVAMTRELIEPIPDTTLPQGFVIRPIQESMKQNPLQRCTASPLAQII